MGPRRGAARSRGRFRLRRVALGLALVLVATGLGVGSETTAGWADIEAGVTLTPVADATVTDTDRDTNFGGDALLGVDNKPRREAYLRFSVPAGANGRATLRLWVVDPTKDAPRVRRYAGTLDEMAVTWRNRVAPLVGTAVDAGGPIAAGTWTEWDVTELVTGFSDVTLALTADTQDGVDFGSRESQQPPQLVIGPAPAQRVFGAVADTRVEEKNPGANFGAVRGLAVDVGSGVDVHSYLRFAVSGLTGTVQRASLRVFVTDATENGPSVFATADGWSESSLTWAGRPAAAGSELTDVGAVAEGWATVDVTGAVAGNGSVNLLLVGDDSDGMWFRSREGDEGERPQLVVETSAPTPTTTTSSTTTSSTTTSTSTTTTSSTTTSSTTTTTTIPQTRPECGPDWDEAEPFTRLASGLGEMSGFAASPVHSSWGWGIRDSSNPASLYAIRPSGSTPKVVEFRAYGLNNSDWEDVAYTPGFAPGSGHLWVLENVGNSWTGSRWIHQFEELDPDDPPPPPPPPPTTTTTSTSTTTTTVPDPNAPPVETTTTTGPPPPPPPPSPATHVGSYRWAYPDVQVNTETMFVFDGDLVVVTKTKPSRVYRFDGPLLPFIVNTPTYVGSLPVGHVLSIAAMSADQRTLAFSNHGKIDIYENRGDVHDLAALIANPIFQQKMKSDNREGGSFFPYGSCDIVLVAESKTLWRLRNR